ncbi:MFS transporter [Leifsonia sp. TF02-11]|uniref:MFS transporter n=1 Tax=Leifsonia sp. TF02-11 TaxID=2815212 RepID=UPI001AA1D42D|nr:MFS transporter [Leifsonia sp. TF02-11]MBO1740768.1 MFS transporter [Leifsonia sp. TF02-11]
MSDDAAAVWRRTPALVVAAAMFMEQLDGIVLFTAMPSIARDFALRPSDVTIASTAYLVAAATFIPLGGWLAARFGGRRVFCAALMLFGLASLGCALSPDLLWLASLRLMQGFGGALMVPIGRLVVVRSATPAQLLRAIAYLTWPALVAPVVAPLLGGMITSTIGWRWIFALNIPIALVTLLVALRVIRATPESRLVLDVPGLVLCTVAVFGLIAVLELLSSGASWAAPIATGAAAVAVAVAGVRHLLHTADPLLDLRAYSIRTFRAANSSGVAYRLAVTSVPFLMPLLLQEELGQGPVTAGFFVAAVFLGNVGIKPATTPLLRAFSFRSVLIVSTVAAVAFLAFFAATGPATSPPLLWVALLLSGVFRSIGFTAYASLAYADVPKTRLTAANTLSSTVQDLGTAVGVALGATVLRLAFPTTAGAPQLASYHIAFAVMAVIAVVAVVGAFRLPRGAADAVRVRPVVSDP